VVVIGLWSLALSVPTYSSVYRHRNWQFAGNTAVIRCHRGKPLPFFRQLFD
jgi:hypothetical protein